MIVLAFDFGGSTGVCVGPKANPTTLTLTLPRNIGPLLSRFEGAVRGLIEKEKPHVLGFETPFINFSKKRGNEKTTVMRSFGQCGAIMRLAHDFQLPVFEYESRTVRKQFCGAANASEEAILKACYRHGVKACTAHEADAGLIWLKIHQEMMLKSRQRLL